MGFGVVYNRAIGRERSRMNRIATLLIVSTAGVCFIAAPLRADEPQTVRMMSFNIRYGTANDGALPETPVIVSGDFNCRQGSPPYDVLFGKLGGKKSRLVDTYRTAHPKRAEGEGTFSGFKPGGVRGPRIDWIGANEHWKVTSASIDRTSKGGRTPSDHFPVTAVLQRRAK